MPDSKDNVTETDEESKIEATKAEKQEAEKKKNGEEGKDERMKDEPSESKGGEAKDEPMEDASNELKGGEGGTNGEQAEAQPKSEDNAEKAEVKSKEEDGAPKASTKGDAVEKSAEREKTTPSSILEKGIIYFFFRGRVGIDEPSDVNDIARSYIVLRPIPHGAKLGDGPMGDNGNNRVLALPKKVLPTGPKDRFMVFVDKAKSTIEDIKKDFLSASDYATKTAGTRHTPPATPIGEGIYAFTSTGRETHLAYILTLPSEITEVQKDIGLQQRGSFVTSLKNPQYSGPANAQLPEGPKFPQE